MESMLCTQFAGTSGGLTDFNFCVFIGNQEIQYEGDGFPVTACEDLLVVGLAVCWGGKDAYYISLQQKSQEQTGKEVFSKGMHFREAYA